MYTYSFNNMDFKYSNNCLNKRKKKRVKMYQTSGHHHFMDQPKDLSKLRGDL